jgi:hypothetical protein
LGQSTGTIRPRLSAEKQNNSKTLKNARRLSAKSIAHSDFGFGFRYALCAMRFASSILVVTTEIPLSKNLNRLQNL